MSHAGVVLAPPLLIWNHATEPPLQPSIPQSFILLAMGSTALLRAAPPAPRIPVGEESLVGARACAQCHEREYRDWLSTPHASAADLLPADHLDNPACTSCHSTGSEPHLRHVQCESCHGPGQDYWPDYVMRDPFLARALGMIAPDDPGVCARCHTADTPSIEPFDFRGSLPLVSHLKDRQ